ncbi:flagellin N-terminal helical domain-containing protein [Brevibacillus fluminis]|uniref:flagellin N-terminal helical domain-containing protein n=1 Tax=Brevibacillus fluminis TaxID=511487 RepID=UPI003F8BDD9A
MRINHNIAALNTYRQLSQNQNNVSKSLERLSSGLRINRASDDAAGLAVSEKMRTQIRGLAMAQRNAMDGVSLIQTAEGALDTVHSMLQRMRELAVQAANGSNTDDDRNSIQAEINALTTEVNRIGNTLEFNTKKLLNGSVSINTITNVGNLKEGTEAITGSLASGNLTIGTSLLTIDSRDKSTQLNGYKIQFGVDNNSPGAKASVTGTIGASTGDLTITSAYEGMQLNNYKVKFVDSDSSLSVIVTGDEIVVSGDWNASVTTAPAALTDVENAINTALQAKGLDDIKLSIDPAKTYTPAEFDGKSFTLTGGQDKVTASLSGRTITVTGDWDNLTATPTPLDVQNAINQVLKSEGLGPIDISFTGTLTSADLANAGSITLAGGVAEVAAKKAERTVTIATTPHQDDVLTIDGKKIGFWDSKDDKYADAATAKAALGADEVIDIYDGVGYKDTSAIASNIVALSSLNSNNFYPNVDMTVSDGGSELIITAKAAGATGNTFATSFKGSPDSGLAMQIGTNTGQQLVIDIPNIRSQAMRISGITSGGTILSQDGKVQAKLSLNKNVSDGVNNAVSEYSIDVSTQENATAAITIYDEAIGFVSNARAKLGAYQNRLEYTESNLSVSEENLTAAESRIRDADMALEMTNFTKNNIINQAATAMLAQANQLPQGVLQLLQ